MTLRFSAVVPVHNGTRFLQRALDSIAAQSLSPWECVIVDDGSSDNSLALASNWANCQAFAAKTLQHPDGGCHGEAAARNLGIRAASGDWIAFLDQDDSWFPEKLERQARFIERYPGHLVVGCFPTVEYEGSARIPFIDEWLERIYRLSATEALSLALDQFIHGSVLCMSGVVAHRDTLLAENGFDTSLPGLADWLMWASLAERYRLALVREALVCYHVHGSNDLMRLRDRPAGFIAAVRDLFERLSEDVSHRRSVPRDTVLSELWNQFFGRDQKPAERRPASKRAGTGGAA